MNKLLALSVVNSEILESGLTPHMRFTTEGGNIGSAPQNQWVLRDRDQRIWEQHCRIIWVDNSFCIEDCSGRLYVNGASMPVGMDNRARLNESDILAIGPYKVRVSMLDNETSSDASSGQLSEMFEGDASSLIVGLDEEQQEEGIAESFDDPLAALDKLQKPVDAVSLDDLGKQQDEIEQVSLIDETRWEGKEQIVQADSNFDTDSAISLHRGSYMDPMMDESELDLLVSEVQEGLKNDWNETMPNQHLVTGPLMRGMGVNIGDVQDTAFQHSLSMEIGSAMQAAIKGLLSMHENADQAGFGLINKNLQPIEDNPLRLGLDYEDTVKTLFDDKKSLVHLSPAAAVAESLRSLEAHNIAVQHAISVSLENILEAFSPEVLLKRFARYRKMSDASLSERQDWAWKMYESYYKELTSPRQQGFKKLFWEVFEQAYDKKLRELQREY